MEIAVVVLREVRGAPLTQSGRREMEWVKLPNLRPCETCGTALQHWVRLMTNGQRSIDVTFCPLCSLEVKAMVEAESLSTSGSTLC